MAVKYNSSFSGSQPFSDVGAMVYLDPNVALEWTVPGNSNRKYRAEFAFGSNDYVWIAYNKTAVAPTPGAVVDTNQQEFRPCPRYVFGGTTLSFITTQTGIQCGVSLMEVPNPM